MKWVTEVPGEASPEWLRFTVNAVEAAAAEKILAVVRRGGEMRLASRAGTVRARELGAAVDRAHESGGCRQARAPILTQVVPAAGLTLLLEFESADPRAQQARERCPLKPA